MSEFALPSVGVELLHGGRRHRGIFRAGYSITGRGVLGTSRVDAVYTAKVPASRVPANKRIGVESAVTPMRPAHALRGMAGLGVQRGAVGVAERSACWPFKDSE